MPASDGSGSARLALTASQVLAYRQRVGGLTRRRRRGPDAFAHATRVGVTDSMPRAALLSLHARVEGVTPDVLDDPTLAQVWGPRFSVYVVAAHDVAPFTLGRLPTDDRGLARARDIASRLGRLLDGRGPVPMGEAGRALGIHPNALRYAAPTGTVRIRWDGARQPTVWVVPPPDVEPVEARLELARRHLHVMGPGTATTFSSWAGVRPRAAEATFAELRDELLPVDTPVGDAWILAGDEAAVRGTTSHESEASGVRLLPSGDAYWLLWGDQRRLLVADPARRERLWTSRVWPGALLLDGEIVGTWRRAGAGATVSPWRRLSASQRRRVEAEAATLPLPEAPIRVTWEP